MIRLFCSLVFLISCSATAWADQFCTDIKTVLAHAPTEFADIKGEPIIIGSIPDSVRLFSGTRLVQGASTCTIAQQGNENTTFFSTSYTCSFEGETINLTSDGFVAKVGECLDITQWMEQVSKDGNVAAVLGQYGLIRVSFTQQSDGIGFGFEAFRDANGEIYGSPKRGNRKSEDGRDRCTPKTPGEIDEFYKTYGARDGATPFENGKFKGFTNKISSPLVAFVTKPSHEAHPALIVRDVRQQNGSTSIMASGDFAGDCEAFHDLLAEVAAMNDSVGSKD